MYNVQYNIKRYDNHGRNYKEYGKNTYKSELRHAKQLNIHKTREKLHFKIRQNVIYLHQ